LRRRRQREGRRFVAGQATFASDVTLPDTLYAVELNETQAASGTSKQSRLQVVPWGQTPAGV
jgi:CO/xanthine dehydrogenase Mo-binding subunit